MGNCVSHVLQCCGLNKDDPSQLGDSGDRAQLIDPSSNCGGSARTQNETYLCKYTDPVFPKKPEEQSDLNKILQDMATNVLDVASLGSHSLEQHEYRERISFYFNKMKSPTLTKSLCNAQRQELLIDVPNPDKLFQSPCSVSADELKFIHDVLSNVDNLLSNLNFANSDTPIIPFQVQN